MAIRVTIHDAKELVRDAHAAGMTNEEILRALAEIGWRHKSAIALMVCVLQGYDVVEIPLSVPPEEATFFDEFNSRVVVPRPGIGRN